MKKDFNTNYFINIGEYHTMRMLYDYEQVLVEFFIN